MAADPAQLENVRTARDDTKGKGECRRGSVDDEVWTSGWPARYSRIGTGSTRARWLAVSTPVHGHHVVARDDDGPKPRRSSRVRRPNTQVTGPEWE